MRHPQSPSVRLSICVTVVNVISIQYKLSYRLQIWGKCWKFLLSIQNGLKWSKDTLILPNANISLFLENGKKNYTYCSLTIDKYIDNNLRIYPMEKCKKLHHLLSNIRKYRNLIFCRFFFELWLR